MIPGEADLFADIAAVTGVDCAAAACRPVSGGDINEAWQLTCGDGTQHFLKLNQPQQYALFTAERAGLAELRAAGAVRVPEVTGCGATASQAWLLMEWLPFSGKSARAAQNLGWQLATLHRQTADSFGGFLTNWIGTTEQHNTSHDDWATFFREERLGRQLTLAEKNGASAAVLETGYRLMDVLAHFFTTRQPEASLLHGDLWGGNWNALADHTPVIFDPAVYYGDRETDIAMTYLFGGFSEAFYSAYNETWPLETGHEERRDLYNLYHVLNHYNLFGGGYLSQAETMMQRLLAQL